MQISTKKNYKNSKNCLNRHKNVLFNYLSHYS